MSRIDRFHFVELSASFTLALLVAAILAAPAPAGIAGWDQLNQNGMKSLHDGNLKDAQTYFDLALQAASKPDTSQSARGTVINNIGLLRLQQRKFTEAQDFFLRALKLSDSSAKDDNLDVATILENVGVSYAAVGKYVDAEPYFRRALAIYERCTTAHDSDRVESLTKAATFFSQKEDDETAELLYQRALNICKTSTVVDKDTKADCLNHAAEFFENRGLYDDAESLLQSAVAVSDKSAIRDHQTRLLEKRRHSNLIILRPKLGEAFDDEPIFVKLDVQHFNLVPPEQNFGDPTPGDLGHIHIMVDFYPLVATSSTQHMFGKIVGDSYLPKGRHTLTVELVHDNHKPLTPRVLRTVTFYTGHFADQPPTAPE